MDNDTLHDNGLPYLIFGEGIVMYDSFEESGDDFKKEYQVALKPIEEYLKPYLRSKA